MVFRSSHSSSSQGAIGQSHPASNKHYNINRVCLASRQRARQCVGGSGISWFCDSVKWGLSPTLLAVRARNCAYMVVSHQLHSPLRAVAALDQGWL